MFPCSLAWQIDEVYHPWYLSYHGEVYEFEALILQFLNLSDTLQCVNSMVWLARYNCYSRYRGF